MDCVTYTAAVQGSVAGPQAGTRRRTRTTMCGGGVHRTQVCHTEQGNCCHQCVRRGIAVIASAGDKSRPCSCQKTACSELMHSMGMSVSALHRPGSCSADTLAYLTLPTLVQVLTLRGWMVLLRCFRHQQSACALQSTPEPFERRTCRLIPRRHSALRCRSCRAAIPRTSAL